VRTGSTFLGRLALSAVLAGWILLGPVLTWDRGSLNFAPIAAQADVTYIYDRLGRLIGVVDPAGDTAVYHYDAVGNLTSISRQSTALVSVIDFNPASGPVGTAVTIYGTGFSPTASENTVTFNGTAASVSSASPTQLVVTVPAGATTGSIGVTAPAGSASGSSPFTVTATSGAPTITSFTPAIATPGTAVSITGTNFEPTPTNNRLRFNIVPAPITSSTATSIAVSVPGGATSGRLSLATPGGATQSTDDFFVPPPPNTAANVSFTGRAVIGGATLNATITAVGKIALIVFDGTAGQQVSVGISAGGVVETDTWVFHPNGTQIAWVYSDNNGRDIQIESLPVTGTYTIRLAQRGFSTGTKPITLSQDLILGPIVVGGASVPVNITRPGQRARLTFAGTAGQRLTLGFPGASAFDAITVTKPDGTTFATSPGNTDLSIVMPPLPTDGTYGILVDPRYADTRNMTLTLSEEVSGALVVDGSALPLTLGRVGQVARVTFSATANQRLNLAVTNANLSAALTILKPDGTTWVPPTTVSNGLGIDTAPVPTTGIYTIVIDPGATVTGSLTLTLSAEIVGSITIGGSPVSVSVTRPGQKVRLLFSGTTGQRISLTATGVTGNPSPNVRLLNPNGSLILFPYSQMNLGASAFMGPFTLPAIAPDYAVYLVTDWTGTGSATFTLHNVPADVTGTLTINGPAAPVNITAPGQNSSFTFTGTAGQVVTLRGASNTIGCGGFVLFWPNGNLTSTTPCGTTFSMGVTLQTGTHTLNFDPQFANTGSVNLSVTQP
jgi:YD repeat-containing protein